MKARIIKENEIVKNITTDELIKMMKKDNEDYTTTFFVTQKNKNNDGLNLRVMQTFIKDGTFLHKCIFVCNLIYDNDNMLLWEIAINMINESNRIVCTNMTDASFFEDFDEIFSSKISLGDVYMITNSRIDLFDEVIPINKDRRENGCKRKYISVLDLTWNEDESLSTIIINSGYFAEKDELILNSVLNINAEDSDSINGTWMNEMFSRSEEIYCTDEHGENFLNSLKEKFCENDEYGKIIRIKPYELASKCKFL